MAFLKYFDGVTNWWKSQAILRPGFHARNYMGGVINNWIGAVYQLTHVDRRRPFRDGVDPADPLGLLHGGHAECQPLNVLPCHTTFSLKVACH